MKKKMIFITLLISSYFLFFFIIDTNKQDIKFFLIERGIWNSKIYVYVQNLFISKKASLKTKDRNYENNSSKSFALNHFSENHLVYDLEAINKTANKKINYGYITSVNKKNNSLKIFTSAGYLFDLDENFNLRSFYELNQKISTFYTDFAYGGIRGAVWLTTQHAVVYSTFKKNNEYFVGLLPIYFDNKGKINFDKVYYLEKLPNQDGSTSNLGGGMEIYNNSIYLSVGTTAIPDELEKNILAQDNKTFFGKILKIPYSFDGSSMDLGKAMIISKGHRNSQGFKFFGNKLLSVEHGPRGGDEINLIRTDEKNIYNYGWPDFSYGLLYSSQTPYKSDNSSLESNSNVRVDNYEHYYNNKNTNYIDPIFHFTPSIGISDIAECPFKSSKYQQYSSCFLISSLKGESFYVMKLLENQKNNNVNIHSVEKVFVGSRIRKIYTENNTVYLFLDNLKVIKILYNTK